MGIETLGLAYRHGRRPQRPKLLWPAPQDRRSLHEVKHAEAGREPRRARRRQHVVGAADIIANRLRRVGTEKDRASISDPRGEAFRIEVRLTKSSTDRPDEKRAERAVGSTWLEPAT